MSTVWLKSCLVGFDWLLGCYKDTDSKIYKFGEDAPTEHVSDPF